MILPNGRQHDVIQRSVLVDRKPTGGPGGRSDVVCQGSKSGPGFGNSHFVCDPNGVPSALWSTHEKCVRANEPILPIGIFARKGIVQDRHQDNWRIACSAANWRMPEYTACGIIAICAEHRSECRTYLGASGEPTKRDFQVRDDACSPARIGATGPAIDFGRGRSRRHERCEVSTRVDKTCR